MEVSLCMTADLVSDNICSKAQTDWVKGIDIVEAQSYRFLNSNILLPNFSHCRSACGPSQGKWSSIIITKGISCALGYV